MRILIACERSGIVRRAMRAAGHDAYSCDLAPADDGSPYHIQADAAIVAYGQHWDLLIAHPPCTYLCNSGAGRMHHTPPNPSPGVPYGPARVEAMHRAAQLVAALWNAPIARVCIENPIMHGKAREAIQTASMIGRTPIASVRWSMWHDFGRPDQTIQPYQFGDDASKRTALWLRGLPALRPTQYIEPRMVDGRPRWANQTDSGQNKLTPSADRAQRRAETYPGIAHAMAEQWTT